MGVNQVFSMEIVLPLQETHRQDGGSEKEDTSVTDINGNETVEVSSVPVSHKVRPRRWDTTPNPASTQPVEVTKKVTFTEPESEVND